MDISFMKSFVAKPHFIPGKVYTGKIIEAKEKVSGVTLEIDVPEIADQVFWHLSLSSEKAKTRERSMGDLKGILEMTGEVNRTEDLVGKTIQVRLTAQATSTLPNSSLPTATASPEEIAELV